MKLNNKTSCTITISSIRKRCDCELSHEGMVRRIRRDEVTVVTHLHIFMQENEVKIGEKCEFPKMTDFQSNIPKQR